MYSIWLAYILEDTINLVVYLEFAIGQIPVGNKPQ